MRIAICLAILLSFSNVGISNPRGVTDVEKDRIRQSLSKQPLLFIENRGQMNEEAAYYVRGSDQTLYFTSKGVTLALEGKEGRWAVKVDFVNANPKVMPRGEDRNKVVFSYFKGRPEEWKTGLSTFGKLVYSDLWPGIDLVYSGAVGRLKYELIVHPGADAARIRFACRGAGRVILKETGELKVTTPLGSFEDGKPCAYQVIAGKHCPVAMRYALEEEPRNGTFNYGFDLGPFDPDRPLILDPVLPVYCGYIGGSDQDWGENIALDSAGNAYVVGWAYSSELTFPVLAGPDLTHNGFRDAFVAKISPDGANLVYCGYIGGKEEDLGSGIAVDDSGNAYISGHTKNNETGFPVKVGPDLT
jgi:hypothetical protein